MDSSPLDFSTRSCREEAQTALPMPSHGTIAKALKRMGNTAPVMLVRTLPEGTHQIAALRQPQNAC